MKKGILLLILLFAGFSCVFADARYYAWTYHFSTLKPGEVEAEAYLRLTQADIKDGSSAGWLRQIEVETGVTDRLDLAAYIVDSVDTGSSVVNFHEIKVRARYKFADNPGDLPVDPLVYAEYIFGADRSGFDEVEFKAVLARDFGPLNAAVNIFAEVSNRNWFDGSNWETGYSAGISHEFFDGALRLGAEAKGNWQTGSHMAGPSISLEAGKLWIVISPLFGLGEKADDVSVQAITGIMF